MRIRSIVLALSLVPVSVMAQGSDSLAGAWEQTSARNVTTGQAQDPAPPALHVVYSNGHYVQFRAAANRAKTDVPRDKMNRDQLFERGNMQGQYGTYRVAGSTLTRRTISAANPNLEGNENKFEFRVQGDTLTLMGTTAQGQKTEQSLRRLR